MRRAGASRLTVTLLGATSETIALGGRTYSRNATTGRWEYLDGGGGGFDPARLAIADPAQIRAAAKTFTRVGAETINGEADDALAGRCRSGRPARGDPRRGWRHRAPHHLHDEHLARGWGWAVAATGSSTRRGTVTSRNATNAYRLALTFTYGKFDTNVAIIAPTGAVAATPSAIIPATPIAGAAGGVSGAAPVPTLTPIGEATSDVGVFSATHIVRLVAILSLVVIGAVLVVAVRRGGRRQGARPVPRSTRVAALRPRRDSYRFLYSV